jgi:hypothetical protein
MRRRCQRSKVSGETDHQLPVSAEHSPARHLDQIHAEANRAGEGLDLHHDLPLDLGEALAQQGGQLGRKLLREVVRQARRRQQPNDDRLLAGGRVRWLGTAVVHQPAGGRGVRTPTSSRCVSRSAGSS